MAALTGKDRQHGSALLVTEPPGRGRTGGNWCPGRLPRESVQHPRVLGLTLTGRETEAPGRHAPRNLQRPPGRATTVASQARAGHSVCPPHRPATPEPAPPLPKPPLSVCTDRQARTLQTQARLARPSAGSTSTLQTPRGKGEGDEVDFATPTTPTLQTSPEPKLRGRGNRWSFWEEAGPGGGTVSPPQEHICLEA